MTSRKPVSAPTIATPMSRTCMRASAASFAASAASRRCCSSRRACSVASTAANGSLNLGDPAGVELVTRDTSSTPRAPPCAASGTSHHLASAGYATPRSRSLATADALRGPGLSSSPASIHAATRGAAAGDSSVRGLVGRATPSAPRRIAATVSR